MPLKTVTDVKSGPLMSAVSVPLPVVPVNLPVPHRSAIALLARALTLSGGERARLLSAASEQHEQMARATSVRAAVGGFVRAGTAKALAILGLIAR